MKQQFRYITICAIIFLPFSRGVDIVSTPSSSVVVNSPRGLTQTYHAYLPLVYKQIPEILDHSGRWPHSFEQTTAITYKWVGNLVNPNHNWRMAFASGIDDWNLSPTHVVFLSDSGSSNTIDVVNDASKSAGYCLVDLDSSGRIIIRIRAYGNLYWDSTYGYSINQRRSIAAHEIGHMQSIGEIPRSFTTDALMVEWSYLYELENLYSPRAVDIALVNQVYP